MEIIPFTSEGFVLLEKELENLKKVQRPKIIEQIAEARAHGDLKENMEYHAAREKQQFIESRIKYLDDRLSRGQVVDISKEKPELVKFGAWVTVVDEESQEQKCLRIVGDPEADVEQNKISLSSPLAKALLGKKVDDLAHVNTPKGIKEYIVEAISYKPPKS